ncbi:MAG TPA: biotin--[acetyl-CoA-carboxylase] ligase, partial [bacterium]|nr:biotin--[acetyl-CoA-carboxylase] ligase [bacterium]
MSIDEQLVRVLHEKGDHFISGEELAETLGVTRTAIWNHISRLRDLGYTIDALPHHGYRLAGIPDKMLPDEIRNVLTADSFVSKIHAYDRADSTNDIAMRLAEGGALEGELVVAEQQLKGRGRLGRNWFSPKGSGLWLSLILRPSLPPSAAPQATLAGAVAVAKAIRETTGCEAHIKWPNDVVIRGRKVCGILTEM